MNDLLLSEELRTLVLRSVESFDDHRCEGQRLACWEMLHSSGSRLWLDTGDIEQAAALWNPAFEALTTNNTLLNHEIQKGIYDRLILEVGRVIRKVSPDLPDDEMILETAFVLNAVHGLRLVRSFGGKVSVELHTALADDVDRSVAYGMRYHDICPEKFIVKIPFSAAGLIAAGKLRRQDIAVNFTLGFSARQNYLAALFANPTFVNVFMGRLNAFTADNRLGSGANVGEKATLATQRQLLQLRHSGLCTTSLIGASIRDQAQIEALAGIDVMTMPPKAAQAFADDFHNRIDSIFHDDPQADNGDRPWFEPLWSVSDEFSATVFKLQQIPIGKLTPAVLMALLRANGQGGLFPDWSIDDIATLRADGKIPVAARWRRRLEENTVGLDALMTAAAFQSFTHDQQELDERIAENLP